jgi:hypothetical protein
MKKKTVHFAFGSTLVIMATFLYSMYPYQAPGNSAYHIFFLILLLPLTFCPPPFSHFFTKDQILHTAFILRAFVCVRPRYYLFTFFLTFSFKVNPLKNSTCPAANNTPYFSSLPTIFFVPFPLFFSSLLSFCCFHYWYLRACGYIYAFPSMCRRPETNSLGITLHIQPYCVMHFYAVQRDKGFC